MEKKVDTRLPTARKQKERVMFSRYTAYVGLVIVLFVSFGCATAPHEHAWGKSFEMIKDAQMLDTDTSENLDPVTGLDGQAAENDMKRYRGGPEGEKGSGGGAMESLLGTLGGTGTK
jgi:hypothetical protein